MYHIGIILFSFLIFIAESAHSKNAADILSAKPPANYVCPPCPHVKHLFKSETYAHPGKCPVCGMTLLEQNHPRYDGRLDLHSGDGNFIIASESNKGFDKIVVFYHMPKTFSIDSKILIVLAGSGRNAWSYRDSWKAESEKHNVLILAPYYAPEEYDFAAYHLGGTVASIQFKNIPKTKKGETTNQYHLNDSDIKVGAMTDREQWIFHDFDRIFLEVVKQTGSHQQQYDIFGHSAGGQILQRMALFYPDSKADRIIAANSGFYTLANFDENYPFGLKATQLKPADIDKAFSNKLILLLGELDNQKETRGIALHTPTLDKRGLGRIDRGIHFHNASKTIAQEKQAKFNWQLIQVPGVGHDFEKMGSAAAKFLYGDHQ